MELTVSGACLSGPRTKYACRDAGALSTPTFIIIPMITIWCACSCSASNDDRAWSSSPLCRVSDEPFEWNSLYVELWRAGRFGIFPIIINWWAALGVTIYGISTQLVGSQDAILCLLCCAVLALDTF